MTWADLKTGTTTLLNYGSDENAPFVNTITVDNDNEVTLTLDEGGAVKFRLSIDIPVGVDFNTASYASISGQSLQINFTGEVGTNHQLQWGRDSDEDYLQAHNSTTGETIDLFDAENGFEFVGPTKLAGLATDLTADEQAAIRTKHHVASGDVEGTVYVNANLSLIHI